MGIATGSVKRVDQFSEIQAKVLSVMKLGEWYSTAELSILCGGVTLSNVMDTLQWKLPQILGETLRIRRRKAGRTFEWCLIDKGNRPA